MPDANHARAGCLSMAHLPLLRDRPASSTPLYSPKNDRLSTKAPRLPELPSRGSVCDRNRRHSMAQTLRDFLRKVENLPPDTLLCVAEVDEAFATHVEEFEIVENAKQQ